MKVCMLTTSYPAYQGDTKAPFIHTLSTSLVKQGASVTVIAPAIAKSKSRETMDGVVVRRFSYFFPRRLQRLTGGGGIPMNLTSSWLALLQFPLFFLSLFFTSLSTARKADIIHCQWSFTALAGVMLKWIYRKPLLMTERGSSAYLAMKHPFMKRVLIFLLNRCDLVTANNEHQLQLFRRLGIPKQKLHLLVNGISTKLFKPYAKQASRKKLRLPKDQTILLYVGRLVAVKGPEHLMKALPEVLKKKKDVHCYVIGEGLLQPSLEKTLEELGIRSSVTFLGNKPLKMIPHYMSAADFVVLSSINEGRPNVIAESFACFTPVVASALPGVKELFASFPYGVLAQPKSSSSLAKAILSAFKKNWKTAKYKKQHIQFRKTFTWSACAERHILAYWSILGRDNKLYKLNFSSAKL